MSPPVRRSCSLTVLRSRSGVLTKRIALSSAAGWQVVGFSAGAWFSVHERPAGSFEQLAQQLEQISRDRLAAVVRGRLLPHADPARCRRLSDRAAHGDAVTFAPAPRRWLALDVDSVPEPLCLTFAAEPEAGVEHVLGLLPEPFAGRSCWWQATSRTGWSAGPRCRWRLRVRAPVVNSAAITVELTELRKEVGILSKRITLGGDGKPKSDGSGCRLTVGVARRHRMNGSEPAGVLADYLNCMDSKTALALGCMSDVVGDECRVVSKKRLADFDDGTPTITRTLDNFAFSSGPGWALIDHDTKGMPAAVADKLAELGGPEGALGHLIPGYDETARVARASTSSGLSHAETGEQFPGSGGRHDYVLLSDQRDAPRFLKALHKQAWRSGLGWILVGTAGQLLERSIVDVSVGSPERLVFEGAPVVVAPLVQDLSLRAAIASAATSTLDSRKAVPDLTAAEEAEYRRLVAAERARLKPQAKAEQKKWIAHEGAKLGPDGERIVKAALAKRTLSGGWSLQFDDDDLGTVTVDAIMADPAKYDGETLADPIDGIEYGPGKAKLFVNDDGTIVVNSFAHGGRSFRLLHGAASARAAIEKAGEEAAKIYIKVILAADINAGEEDQLLDLVRDLTGIGKRPLKADLKRAKAEAARERAEERAERSPVPDRRITKRAPLPDEERLPVVTAIEEVLRAEAPPTIFQNVMAEVVRVAEQRSALLHVLTSATAAGGVHADMFAPAPASPLIVAHTIDSMREVIERRIRYLQDNEEGGPPRVVTLAEGFIRALLAPRPNSTLPLLVAVSDVPVVTPSGKVIVAGGYHAESGIFFTCSEDEARAIVPEDLSEAAVRDAYLFLADELFVDVALHERASGMAALFACLLTGMSHPVLPEKPVFCVKAPQRGSGKTTLVNMIVRPITRRSAVAASWSVNEEERRKSFLRRRPRGPRHPHDRQHPARHRDPRCHDRAVRHLG